MMMIPSMRHCHRSRIEKGIRPLKGNASYYYEKGFDMRLTLAVGNQVISSLICSDALFGEFGGGGKNRKEIYEA